MNGLASSNWIGNYLFLDSAHWSKSKRENTQGLAKNFSSGYIPLAYGTNVVSLLIVPMSIGWVHMLQGI